MISRQSPLKMGVGEQRSSYGTRSITAPLLLKRLYHYFRLWRNTTVWVHLYRGEREKPVIRLSSACSQAKLGLDLQAWINRTRWWSAQGSAADTWAQNARLRSCRALRVCRYDSWGAIGDHARIFLASVPKRRR